MSVTLPTEQTFLIYTMRVISFSCYAVTVKSIQYRNFLPLKQFKIKK